MGLDPQDYTLKQRNQFENINNMKELELDKVPPYSTLWLNW